MNQLQHVLSCHCRPDYVYSSRQTFNKHFHTQHHQLYELVEQRKQDKIQLEQCRIRIQYLEKVCLIWKEKYFQSLSGIHTKLD